MNKLVILLSFLGLIVLTSSTEVSLTKLIDNKLTIVVYYESQCPDSRRFIVEQMPRALSTFSSSLVNFVLIPFGKADYTWQSNNNSWSFQCQHGPEECYGNMIQGCYIYYRQNFSDHYPFINCAMSNINGSRLQNAIDCNQASPVPEFNDVIECSKGALGNQLKYAYGVMTHSLVPPLYYVPWITFDNVYSDDDRKEAESDVISVICKKLDGLDGLPTECRKNSAITNMKFNVLSILAFVLSFYVFIIRISAF